MVWPTSFSVCIQCTRSIVTVDLDMFEFPPGNVFFQFLDLVLALVQCNNAALSKGKEIPNSSIIVLLCSIEGWCYHCYTSNMRLRRYIQRLRFQWQHRKNRFLRHYMLIIEQIPNNIEKYLQHLPGYILLSQCSYSYALLRYNYSIPVDWKSEMSSLHIGR